MMIIILIHSFHVVVVVHSWLSSIMVTTTAEGITSVNGHKHLNTIRHQNASQLGAQDHGRAQEIGKISVK